MSLKSRIDQDIKSAMLRKEKSELDALRAIKSMILLAETEKGKAGDLDDQAELKLLMRAAKQRRESAEIFQRENRVDLFETEMQQLNIINRYLPQPLSSEELVAQVKEMIVKLQASGAKDLGKVMGVATQALAGRVDSKELAEEVKRQLGG